MTGRHWWLLAPRCPDRRRRRGVPRSHVPFARRDPRGQLDRGVESSASDQVVAAEPFAHVSERVVAREDRRGRPRGAEGLVAGNRAASPRCPGRPGGLPRRLTGFPDAIEAVFPEACVKTCIVHQIRARMRYVIYQDRKRVAADLKPVYRAINAEAAAQALETFDDRWGEKYSMIAESCGARWEHIIPFLSLPADLRRAVHRQHHREPQSPETRGHLPTHRPPPTHLPRHPAIRTQRAQGVPLDRRAPRSQDPLRRPTPRLARQQSPRPHTQNVGHPPRAPRSACPLSAPGRSGGQSTARPHSPRAPVPERTEPTTRPGQTSDSGAHSHAGTPTLGDVTSHPEMRTDREV
jgi:hypothetical protein